MNEQKKRDEHKVNDRDEPLLTAANAQGWHINQLAFMLINMKWMNECLLYIKIRYVPENSLVCVNGGNFHHAMNDMNRRIFIMQWHEWQRISSVETDNWNPSFSISYSEWPSIFRLTSPGERPDSLRSSAEWEYATPNYSAHPAPESAAVTPAMDT